MAYNFEYLRQNGPHLICVPKSTLSNWMNELNRWCPSLRAFRFHGNKEERQNQADTYLTNEAASDVGTRPSNTLADGTDDHSKSLRKVRERSGAERSERALMKTSILAMNQHPRNRYRRLHPLLN